MRKGLHLQSQIAELQAIGDEPLSQGELHRAIGLTSSQIADQLTCGLRAKHALVHANKRLVFKAAHRFGFKPDIPFEDSVMVGTFDCQAFWSSMCPSVDPM